MKAFQGLENKNRYNSTVQKPETKYKISIF